MIGEIVRSLNIQIANEVPMGSGERIVRAAWATLATRHLPLANLNVFRLGSRGEVIWQVQRVQRPGARSWEWKHAWAKEQYANGDRDHPYSPEGFYDPFVFLGMDESGALQPEPRGVFRPGCRLSIYTDVWRYDLDPETGIATCTNEQQK